jgi:hypothetical protein
MTLTKIYSASQGFQPVAPPVHAMDLQWSWFLRRNVKAAPAALKGLVDDLDQDVLCEPGFALRLLLFRPWRPWPVPMPVPMLLVLAAVLVLLRPRRPVGRFPLHSRSFTSVLLCFRNKRISRFGYRPCPALKVRGAALLFQLQTQKQESALFAAGGRRAHSGCM